MRCWSCWNTILWKAMKPYWEGACCCSRLDWFHVIQWEDLFRRSVLDGRESSPYRCRHILGPKIPHVLGWLLIQPCRSRTVWYLFSPVMIAQKIECFLSSEENLLDREWCIDLDCREVDDRRRGTQGRSGAVAINWPAVERVSTIVILWTIYSMLYATLQGLNQIESDKI